MHAAMNAWRLPCAGGCHHTSYRELSRRNSGEDHGGHLHRLQTPSSAPFTATRHALHAACFQAMNGPLLQVFKALGSLVGVVQARSCFSPRASPQNIALPLPFYTTIVSG